MYKKPVLKWTYRETNCDETANAKFKGFEIIVQDCDGDMSRWCVKRDGQYIAMGEISTVDPYHRDAAMKLATDVFGYIWEAVEMNDFSRHGGCKNKGAPVGASGECLFCDSEAGEMCRNTRS